MAWTFVLVAGTSTLNLNDGTFYQVNVNGFHAPPPPALTSYAGPNLFRHGADLVERSYGNRTVTVGLSIEATNASTLGQKVQDIWGFLRQAEEYSKDGLGTQVQLRYQWEGATGTYLFDIIEGRLDLGANLHSPYLLKGTRAHNAQLVLEAKPFVTQPSETAMNFLADPSFEIAATPLADWTVSGGGGTGTRSTTAGAKYGTGALWFNISNTGTFMGYLQNVVTTAFASGDQIRATVWFRNSIPSAGAGTGDVGMVRMDIRQLNAGGTSITSQSFSTNATSTGSFLKLTAVVTATGTVGTVRIELFANPGPSATATGTVTFDGVYLGSGALPAAWVSGRSVANHFDDNGQGHINYLDIYDVPGDVPAPIQIKVLEQEAHDEIWVGARHDTRMTGTGIVLEGESFTGTIGTWVATANANYSNGSYGRVNVNTTSYGSMTATAPGTPQVIMQNVALPPVGQFRVLIRAQTDTATQGTLFFGLGYQYGGRTVDPSTTAEYVALNSSSTLGQVSRLYDLGVITIPPFKTPVGATIGTLGLRIAYYISSATINGPQVDFAMLIPINEGGVYGSKTSAADNLWVDSLSSPAGIYRVTTADVAQSFPPAQVGAPPLAHPKGSRFYFQFGSGTTIISMGGGTVGISYTPRYLHVGT